MTTTARRVGCPACRSPLGDGDRNDAVDFARCASCGVVFAASAAVDLDAPGLALRPPPKKSGIRMRIDDCGRGWIELPRGLTTPYKILAWGLLLILAYSALIFLLGGPDPTTGWWHMAIVLPVLLILGAHAAIPLLFRGRIDLSDDKFSWQYGMPGWRRRVDLVYGAIADIKWEASAYANPIASPPGSGPTYPIPTPTNAWPWFAFSGLFVHRADGSEPLAIAPQLTGEDAKWLAELLGEAVRGRQQALGILPGAE